MTAASGVRAAIVTGAAGGIGAAACGALRAAGLAVIGIDRLPSPAADVTIQLDLADGDALSAAVRALTDEYAIAGVVHCAAVQPLGGVGEVSAESWTRALLVNVLAVELVVAACRESLAATRGSVVVVSSVHGRATTPGIVAYATTKAALEGWVRAAALDLAPLVRVNAVVPGAIDTAKLAEGFERWGPEAAAARAPGPRGAHRARPHRATGGGGVGRHVPAERQRELCHRLDAGRRRWRNDPAGDRMTLGAHPRAVTGGRRTAWC